MSSKQPQDTETFFKELAENSPLAKQKYNQLLLLLDNFSSWSANSKVDFFQNFVTCGPFLDHNCASMVKKFCALPWKSFPRNILPSFIHMLVSCALHTNLYIQDILCCFLGYICCPMDYDTESVVLDYRKMAMSAILDIESTPARPAIIVAIRRSFPHHLMDADAYCGFVGKMVELANKPVSIQRDIWKLIISKMLNLDAFVSKSSIKNAHLEAGNVFGVAEEDVQFDERKDLTYKLDTCMVEIYKVIKTNAVGENGVVNHEYLDSLFEYFWPIFTEEVLSSIDVQSVPFIWFYICSFDAKYSDCMLRMLWKLVMAPPLVPREWKRSQAAAMYLGSFLARANYVSYDTFFKWIAKMSDWAAAYVNESGQYGAKHAGTVQHGVFYAVVQSLLFAFAFRYKEVAERNAVSETHGLGLSRIVHSQLEPLRYISRVVALGFAMISRQLQIVYCSHILDRAPVESPPIDHFLPFSFVQLNASAVFITPFIRNFEPAEVDRQEIATDILNTSMPEPLDVDMQAGDNADDDFDFLDNDEDVKRIDDALKGKKSIDKLLSSSPLDRFIRNVI